ncbi:MAG: ribose 5-phosphate isomerase B [Eubacteriales bacterium]|jgi:ribose 5-phosphate isomerase B|nr:ribose 5-phosphate isomerase B [Eubacteriales bacterium]MDD3866602.1 ribose 5-phosphate isomerase B [Eubacteriales bacterium]MDD4462018.1 ribose 5-phosphate isomerase B [Eubacteriales bacterium]
MTDLWIANDHGGYDLKKEIMHYLDQINHPYNDMGCHSDRIVRYPYYAARVAAAVSRGEIKRGILICSTGIGMSMIANRYPGVRASLCKSTYDARMTREHNDANILCLGGKTTGEFEAIDIVQTWLITPFQGGRHTISLDLIKEAEADMIRPGRIWNPGIPTEDA